jgi:hypothetical protein
LDDNRRGSKDGGRSVSVDGSWRGSRDSLRERAAGGAAGGMTASPLARRQDRDSSQASVAVSVTSSTSSSTATVRSSLSQVHKLTRMSKLAKNEACSLCSKTMSSFFTHGYKCTSCHLVFHAKCVQQGITSTQVSFQIRLGPSLPLPGTSVTNSQFCPSCFFLSRLYHPQSWNVRALRPVRPIWNRILSIKSVRVAVKRSTVRRA